MNLPLAHVAAEFAPLELIPVTIAAVLYWGRVTSLRQRGRTTPAWRQACFAGGLAVIPISLYSPVGHIAEELVIGHMIEHLLIADAAALLVVLGLTGPILQPLLAMRYVGKLRFLAHPAVAFPLWAANLFIWHIPALYDAAYAGAPIHALEHTLFFAFGTLMWMPLVGPLPMPEWFGNGWRLGYTLAVRFSGAILGNILMWSGTVLYDNYGAGEAYWGLSPLADQSTAGAIMMVWGTFLALGTFAYLFFRTANQGIERQRLLDLAGERGVPLDERRAARAIAAGHGALLEERLLAGGGGASDERRDA